jgi:hypothetical protein
MSEEYFNISLEIIDWKCDRCGTYCKPTGIINKQFIGVKVEHMCMNPTCGLKVMLDTHYPKWENLTKAIAKGRNA